LLISRFDSGHCYGFSQGRLTVPPKGELQWFPQDDWQLEFFNAGILGCSFIELLIERQKNESNPLWSCSGRQEIKNLCKKNNLIPYSICLDYIIDNSLFGESGSSAFESIAEALAAASELGCKVLVLPLLEESALTRDNLRAMAKTIAAAGKLAANDEIQVCVETLLSADNLNTFLAMVGLNNVKAVFDTGNRVVEAPDLSSEIIKLGKNIGHVHVKDKDRHGNNVVLGSGLVDFCAVFSALNEIHYQGPLNFETNRGSVPMDTARFNLGLCEFFANNHKNLKDTQ
jgi:sugar phosphate isomerase/epimerase